MFVTVEILDAILASVTGESLILMICDGPEPEDYAAAVANTLVEIPITFGGPTGAEGELRTVEAEAGEGTAVRSGTALWAALTSTGALLFVMACTGEVVADVTAGALSWCISAGLESGCGAA